MRNPTARITIGRYDVEPTSSNRYCIEMDDGTILTEEDPKVELPDDTYTLMDKTLTPTHWLIECGLAAFGGWTHADPYDNGGWMLPFYKLFVGEGTYEIYDDSTFSKVGG